MPFEKTYDECYFINYNSCTDLSLYEIGKQACPPSYSFGPIIRDHYIFHYLISGNGILQLNSTKYEVHAHEGFIIPPNVLAYYIADDSDPWNYIWVHLDGPKSTEYFENSGLNTHNPVFKPISYPNQLDDIMKSLLENNTKELYCIGKIYELFNCLLEQSSSKPAEAIINAKLAYIKKIIDFIHIKYSEPIHMEDLAFICGLERSYMTKLFKNATGHTPQEYLTTYRMKKSCNMLETTDMSVQNISYAVGYGDSFTFSKAFKRYVGVSPSEYKNQQQLLRTLDDKKGMK